MSVPTRLRGSRLGAKQAQRDRRGNHCYAAEFACAKRPFARPGRHANVPANR
jgi:hypothetical protein